MKKFLKEHIDFIENVLQKEDADFDWGALSDFNRTQIGFFQQERLIHLLVTLFFGLIFFASIVTELFLLNVGDSAAVLSAGFLAVNVILLVMLGFYVGHYFFLENGVQKLYQLEKEIIKRCQGKINLDK
jgi:hypothetical protein